MHFGSRNHNDEYRITGNPRIDSPESRSKYSSPARQLTDMGKEVDRLTPPSSPRRHSYTSGDYTKVPMRKPVPSTYQPSHQPSSHQPSTYQPSEPESAALRALDKAGTTETSEWGVAPVIPPKNKQRFRQSRPLFNNRNSIDLGEMNPACLDEDGVIDRVKRISVSVIQVHEISMDTGASI